MKFSELMERVKQRGVEIVESRGEAEILGIAEDSRRVKSGDLFIARTGTKTTGTNYIPDALQKGAVAIVSETPTDLPPTIAFAQVTNANLACALLAHELAGNPTTNIKMIAITGTKGKTTVAYLLRSVLKAAGHKVGMIGTVEIDDGEKTTPADMTTPGSTDLVNLFTRMQKNAVTHCIMEVSSHALHQHRTAGIDFALAIFTNLTGDHLDYHKTMEDYAAAKAMLFTSLKPDATAVINADDKWAEKIVADCPAKQVLYQCGKMPSDDGWAIEIISMKRSGMAVLLRGLGRAPRGNEYGTRDIGMPLDTPLVGRHNAYNLAAVVAAGSVLGLGTRDMAGALSETVGAPGRLQPVLDPTGSPAEMPFSVFVDYAHTHDALENVLTALRTTMAGAGSRESYEAWQHNAKFHALPQPHIPGRLICLFGCGGDRDRTKRPKMAAIAQRLADLVFLTSDNPRTENANTIIEEIAAGFSPNWQATKKITIQPDRRLAIRAAIAAAQPGDVVLLAGKGHENYQIIGTTKHHFDDVEEAQSALRELTP